MEASNSHGVKNITLIHFLSHELLFPFAFTYGTAVHNIPKCEKSRNIIKDTPVYNFLIFKK